MITPENARWVIYLLSGGPFLIGAVVELLTGRAIRVAPGFYGPRSICRRDQQPFEFWLAIVFHLGVAVVLGWLIFFRLN